jgi:cardiolipin synthase
VGWSDISTLLLALLQLANDRIRITTAYFVPDDELVGHLRGASDRGVTVEILLPGPHGDKRFVQLAGQAIYEQLLEHGVRIWHYQPTMLHAKIMTVDGLVANVGSANFNARSIKLDEEINLVALDPDLVAVLDRQFDTDLERSEEIKPGQWEDRSIGRRILEAVTKPLRKKM